MAGEESEIWPFGHLVIRKKSSKKPIVISKILVDFGFVLRDAIVSYISRF